ncbi:glycoside hydrolase family protein, partial [Escherichia coli]|uniref:glycoside hydrolase family protein n=1 Tax=Escherichia coli TaxID=562 RepID=UPI003EB80BB4
MLPPPSPDLVGVWPVCHGHTGPDIIPGQPYPAAACTALLPPSLAPVSRPLPPSLPVALPSTPRVALSSFV